METVTDFIFLGSKIISDGHCSHKIKRRLLLGRKAMTNLDNTLKSRDYFANKDPFGQSYGFCWRRQWHPTPVLLPGKPHGRRSLVGCSPWGREESDTTERLHFHFSLSCIGEGNGNPLQCSCLENPRDGGVWWAAVYGVAQSRTRLKRLSSSSSSSVYMARRAWQPTPVFLPGESPWTEEPGGLQSRGLQRVGHN